MPGSEPAASESGSCLDHGGVYLFYRSKRPRRWVVAVTRRLGEDGFLITTYPTDSIKEGAQMAEVKIYYDREGNTLTVWFDQPQDDGLRGDRR